MTIWKILACFGMLAFFILSAMSITQYEMTLLLGPAFGAANFSILCLILDRLPPPKE